MKFIKLAIVAVILSGCVSSGKDFSHVKLDQLELGKASVVDVMQRLGEPYRSGSINKNGKTFETIVYAYAKDGGEAAISGATPARSQAFYFHKDQLVGSEFTSSWKADSTNFDESKLDLIKENSSSISELTSFLGEAKGEYIYPLVKTEGEKAKVYLFTYSKAHGLQISIYSKRLVATYNAATGIISSLEYQSQGNE
ncbi:MAG: hypothetical protein MI743_07180 [Sneathiellales bacterium]|nr:hypothetical protein [Sneathiellales bacterium]